MRNNNFLKILLGIVFAAAGIWVLWWGWQLVSGAQPVFRTGPVLRWLVSLLVWGGLLRFTIRHYKHLW